MPHFKSIADYNKFLGYPKPMKELIDVVKYDDADKLSLNCSGLTSEFFLMAFKRNMTDLEWYGNTEFDTTSSFLYLIKPDQLHKWNVKERWDGFHILISPVLLREYHIDLSFFQYDVKEALFLTKEEQVQIENLFTQIFIENNKDNYELDLLMAYSNLIFAYIVKCYKRQFTTRQPLYNKVVLEFKKLLDSFYIDNPNELPTVHYFAENLNLSTNYFGDLIKHSVGKTASEMIQDFIIAKAKSKLKSSDETIAEIGYHLGFEYPTYFSRVFKKHTGSTPSSFRKLRISNN